MLKQAEERRQYGLEQELIETQWRTEILRNRNKDKRKNIEK